MHIKNTGSDITINLGNNIAPVFIESLGTVVVPDDVFFQLKDQYGTRFQIVNDIDVVASPLVPIGPTVAVVAKNGDDATGQVGDASKPFLTIEAADVATPALGTIIVYPGDYAVNISTTLRRLSLLGCKITGTINANWLFVQGSGTSGVGFDSSLVGTLNVNLLTVVGLYELGGIITGGTLSGLSHFSNIHKRNSTGNLFPVFEGTSGQGRPFIHNVGEIVCAGSFFKRNNPGSGTTSFTMVKNVSKIRCSKLMDGIDDSHINRFVDIGLIYCDSDVISGTVSGSFTPQVEFNNCQIKSNGGRLANMDGAGSLLIRAFGGTVVDISATENVAWVGSPANRVTVMAPYSASRVTWDGGTGVVNDQSSSTQVLGTLILPNF